MKILTLFFLMFVNSPTSVAIARSASDEKNQVLNQILFYESSQSWTSRDFILFQKIKTEVLQKKKLSQYSESDNEDFILSRLSFREAQLFELQPEKIVFTEMQKKSFNEYSNKEIEQEVLRLGLALVMIEIKENQLNQKLRFKTWLDLLKRKYQVKIKSSEF